MEQLCRQAVQANPRHAAAWFLLGEACLARGAASEAADCFRKALAMHPADHLAKDALFCRFDHWVT